METDLTNADGKLDPVDWPGFRAQAHQMLDDMLSYLENIRQRPVWQPIPDEVRARFRGDIPIQVSWAGSMEGERRQACWRKCWRLD
jgi:hypothetical protein